VPRVRRRVGTAFRLPSSQQYDSLPRRHRQQHGPATTNGGDHDKDVEHEDGEEDGEGESRLEMELELHRALVAAAERLAADRDVNRSVRKRRRKDLEAAVHRLRALEKRKLSLVPARARLHHHLPSSAAAAREAEEAVSLDSGCSSLSLTAPGPGLASSLSSLMTATFTSLGSSSHRQHRGGVAAAEGDGMKLNNHHVLLRRSASATAADGSGTCSSLCLRK
jgi:hypothetical protein